MPFCPQCGYEYMPEITRCSDCDEKLVDSLPSELNSDMKDEKWVPLRNLPGNIYAEMVKEVLDQQGIPSIIQSDPISAAYGAKSASSPGSTARIYVPEKYYEKCKQILLEMMDHI